MTETGTWMPIYWGDYLRDTGHLSAAEHGAYLLLIGHYWSTGCALPDDDEKLRRLARMERAEWKATKNTISAFFSIKDGFWVHSRIDRELSEWQSRKQSNTDRARTAASKRWGKHKQCSEHASSMPYAKLEECPSPSPSPKKEEANASSKEKAIRGSRLPLDWKPSPENQAYAESLGLTVRLSRISDDFSGYWHAKAGKDACKVDWDATWEGWCRREADKLPRVVDQPRRLGL